VRKAAAFGKDCSSHPLLSQGDRVRVARGALAGLEGTLQRYGAKSQLIIAIEMIQRSVAVTVCEDDVEPVLDADAHQLGARPTAASRIGES